MAEHSVKVEQDVVPLVSKRMRFVFATLLLLIIAYPFLDNSRMGLFLYTGLLTLVSLATLYTFSYDRHHLYVSVSLGAAFIIMNWIDFFYEHLLLTIGNTVISTVFFAYVVFVVVQNIMRVHQVNANTLAGAASAYLLIGFTYTSAYGLVNTVVPHTFSTQVGWGELVYYSFSVLTTMGMGDITPIAAVARSITIIEAVTGVLYTAVLIAALLGRVKSE